MAEPKDTSLRGAQEKLKGLLGGQGVDQGANLGDGAVEEVQQHELGRRRGTLRDEPVEQTTETVEETKETLETEDTEVEVQSVETESDGSEDLTQEEEEHIQTIVELAESLDVDLDTLYNLRIPATDPRGQKTEVSLGELKDNLQEYLKVKEEQNRFEQERSTFETQRQQAEQLLVQRLTEADQFLSAFESQLAEEEKSIDWKRLRETNPSEYSALKAEFSEKKDQLRTQRQQISERYQETQQQQMQTMYQTLLQRREQEQQALMKAIPEWKDERKAKSDKENLKKYLLNTGFTEDDVASAMDHRLVVMARKAMLYDQGTKRADVAKKKVKSLPKRVKPGSTTKPDAKVLKRKEMKSKLRQSGSIHDAAALIKSRNLAS